MLKENIKKILLELFKGKELEKPSINVIKSLQDFFGGRMHCIGSNNVDTLRCFYQMDLGKVKKYRMFIDETEVYIRDGFCEFYDEIEMNDILDMLYQTGHLSEPIQADINKEVSTKFSKIRPAEFEDTLKETYLNAMVSGFDNTFSNNLLLFWYLEHYGLDEEMATIKFEGKPLTKEVVRKLIMDHYQFITLTATDIDVQHVLNVANFINKLYSGKATQKDYDDLEINLNETLLDLDTIKELNKNIVSYDEIDALKNKKSKYANVFIYESKKAFPNEKRLNELRKLIG